MHWRKCRKFQKTMFKQIETYIISKIVKERCGREITEKVTHQWRNSSWNVPNTECPKTGIVPIILKMNKKLHNKW